MALEDVLIITGELDEKPVPGCAQPAQG